MANSVFCSFGISIMFKRVFQEKKLDSNILTPENLPLKLPFQPCPMKLTVSQCKKKSVWVFEWVVTSSQELLNLACSGNCCFSSG